MSNQIPNENADNNTREDGQKPPAILQRATVGGTLPINAKPVTIQPADIHPSSQSIVRNVGQMNFADAWRKYWQFPLEFDPVAYAQGASNVVVTLPALSDQRHVVEQIIFSLSDDTVQTLTIQDGQDVIYRQVLSMPTNGGWDYVTFSPCRMQRVPNQPLVVTLTNSSSLATLYVNAWRF